MGFIKDYFPQKESVPGMLSARSERRVRFEEVDSLGMVWHGRFPSYLEDGRIAFGDTYGLTYQSFMENETVAPVVQMHLDYKIPLKFDEKICIETNLHWTDSARLNFSYTIYNPTGAVAASGYTVQLLTDPDGTILLFAPSWLQDFKKKWLEGCWSK
jgi:acyl-CoA thioester hydrolase